MASALAGRITRASPPERIEATLTSLWREAAADGPIARPLMANLVIVCQRPKTEPVDLAKAAEEMLLEAPSAPIIDVARRHPSRVILLVHGHCEDLRGPLAVVLDVMTFGPRDARYGIELIAVRSTCADQSLISIVRRLVLGDVPTSVWWTDDLARRPVPAALMTMGRQLVFDSRQWHDPRAGIEALGALLMHPHAPDLADLSWRRLAPLFKGLSQCLTDMRLTRASSLSRVRIEHAPDNAASGWLVLGWIASRTGWPAGLEPASFLTARPSGSSETMTVSLEIDSGDARGTVRATASMNDRRVSVRSDGQTPELAVAVGQEDPAESVVAELRRLGGDSGLGAAVRALRNGLTP